MTLCNITPILASYQAENTTPTSKTAPKILQQLQDHHYLTHYWAASQKNNARQIHDPSRTQKQRHKFIQINAREVKNFIVVDIDHDDPNPDINLLKVVNNYLPSPHWVFHNHTNNHIQAGWALDTLYFKTQGRKVTEFHRATKNALTNITGADPNFSEHLVRNPFHQHEEGTVYFLHEEFTPYRLSDFKEKLTSYQAIAHIDPEEPITNPTGLVLRGYWDPRSPARVAGITTTAKGQKNGPAAGRNCTTFYGLRAYLWEKRASGKDWEDQEAAWNWVCSINRTFQNPLPVSELATIVRSAIRSVRNGKGAPAYLTGGAVNKLLSRLGKAGGSSRSEKKVQAAALAAARGTAENQRRAAERTQKIGALRKAGHSISEIAHTLHVSIRTVKRHIAILRELVVKKAEAIAQALRSQIMDEEPVEEPTFVGVIPEATGYVVLHAGERTRTPAVPPTPTHWVESPGTLLEQLRSSAPLVVAPDFTASRRFAKNTGPLFTNQRYIQVCEPF